MCDISAPHFHDKDKARSYLENLRWPTGPACPHCGGVEKIYTITGEKVRHGVYKCGDCRKQFTVTVGTLFHGSKIPLNKWLLAVHLMCSSKKGISSHQLHRMLGITYKSAWFMTHRIREAMRDPVFSDKMGGGGSVVEADETFWGNQGKNEKGARGYKHKEKIFSLVERDGRVRSFHVPRVNAKTLRPIMQEQIAKDTHIITDEAKAYNQAAKGFASHESVNHGAKEYVRGQIHTNTIESYFAIVKRGLTGTFHHVSPQHLKRYLSEFDFRYSNRKRTDKERSDEALKGISGKRLTYA